MLGRRPSCHRSLGQRQVFGTHADGLAEGPTHRHVGARPRRGNLAFGQMLSWPLISWGVSPGYDDFGLRPNVSPTLDSRGWSLSCWLVSVTVPFPNHTNASWRNNNRGPACSFTCRLCYLRPLLANLRQSLEHNEERRHEQQGEDGCRNHPANHGRSDCLAAGRTGTTGHQ